MNIYNKARIWICTSTITSSLILFTWIFPNTEWYIASLVIVIISFFWIIVFGFIYKWGEIESPNPSNSQNTSQITVEEVKQEQIQEIKNQFDLVEKQSVTWTEITDWKNKNIEYIGEYKLYELINDFCNKNNGNFNFINDRKKIDKQIDIYLRLYKIKKIMNKT